MSWKTLSNQNKTYKATLTGTENDWNKKVKDIVARKHEIVRQGVNPYKGDINFHKGLPIKVYWAEVKIP